MSSSGATASTSHDWKEKPPRPGTVTRRDGRRGHQEVGSREDGLEAGFVEVGCCGPAGSWGIEKGKYDISMDCGEQAILPAVRKSSDNTVMVARGFSCKTQTEQAAILGAGPGLVVAGMRVAGRA